MLGVGMGKQVREDHGEGAWEAVWDWTKLASQICSWSHRF